MTRGDEMIARLQQGRGDQELGGMPARGRDRAAPALQRRDPQAPTSRGQVLESITIVER